MAESKETIIGIIEQINDATEPGSVTNRMVAAVLNYLAENLITSETMEDIEALERRVGTLETRVDELGIAEINTAISNLRTQLQNESTSRGDADAAIITRLQALENALSTLMEGDVTSAIENFNEVIDFLKGVTDDETLTGLLTTINSRLSALEGDGSVTNQKIAAGAVTGEKIANEAVGTNHIEDDAVTSSKIAAEAVGAGHLTPQVKKMIEDADNVIMISIWTNEQPGIVKDSISKPGVHVWNYAQKKLYVSVLLDDILLVEETPSEEYVYIDRENNIPYVWKEGNMVAIAPKNVPASIFNATIEKPIQGYYVLFDPQNTNMSAVHAAWSAEKAVSGLILSFELSAGIWKTYQYVGKTVTEQNWLNTENWKDFGSLAAGSETYIIINGLIGAPTAGSYYTLETAVARLIAYEESSGVTYRKTGLIISYITGENIMETKQFQGNIADFGATDLWKDFGGGGSTVETSDEPEDGGKDAFSTGGAHRHLPVTAQQVESSDEDYLAYALVNADGDPLGDAFLVPKGGSGSSTSKVFSINFQDSPFYAAAGSQFVLRASIRSVMTEGSSQTSETIERVDIVDRDTSQVLYTNPNLNKASSVNPADYSFSFDLSSFFTAPSNRRLQLIAYDSAGDRATRTITVVAVDVTVESTQTLNYTSSSVVFTNDSVKSLPMYKFPNYQGSAGITAKIEILVDGTWLTLGTADIRDTYSHNISVNPSNVAGVQLTHGAYLIRIQGTDNASGVKGNIIYSTLMVIDPESTAPVLAIRYNDKNNGTVRLYDSVQIEVAAYSPGNPDTAVQLKENGETVTSMNVNRNRVEVVTMQVKGVTEGTALVYQAVSGSAESGTVELVVSGSVIDAALTEGAIYNFDFANRSNSESGDHSIISGLNGEYQITLKGANYSSNGFQKFLGANAMAVKENVKGGLNHTPFADSSVETNGLALLFQFATNNVIDKEAHLMECYDANSGAGFYITGEKIVISCVGGNRPQVVRNYPTATKVTVGIVVEPGATYVERDGVRYSLVKLFLNGDEAGCLGYVPGGSSLLQPSNIKFDGTSGDFYLYYMIAWQQPLEWQQEFYNYLVKLTDTDVMIEEYNFEDVYEGSTSAGPVLVKLAARGMPYIIESPFNGSDVTALDNTTSTKDNNFITLTYRDPSRPWRDFIAYNVRRRNQGTTSAKRPVKNARYNFARKSKNSADTTYVVDGVTYGNVCLVKPLHTRAEIVDMGYDGALWDEAAALMAKNKIRVGENTIPVDVITVKVDYSDSSNANDCGACNMMNAAYRTLGDQYMTPAQRYYDGTWELGDIHLTGLQLNHSTANHPVAMYRDPDGTGANLSFYAKGNWKEDKGEQVALGFKDTPGYNLGCLNYQDEDFIEYFGVSGETLNDIETRFKAEANLDTSKVYLLSLYCGSSYRFMRYRNGAWTNTTGSMKQVNGEWIVTGDVLNPVDGFELLAYTGMDWFMGVSSVADMMAPVSATSAWVQKLVDSGDVSADTFPAWTQFFECMVDNDQLQIDLAMGRKVPYNLYAFLRFCNSCDYSKVEDFKNIWKYNLRYFANPRSLFTYNAFTDYLAAVDQQAKNMQPMFFLDDGHRVENGTYYDPDLGDSHLPDTRTYQELIEEYRPALLMYPNKVYDADGLLGKDNDGEESVDPEVDPNKPSDQETGYTNPYAGWGSVLWNNIYQQQTVLDSQDTEISMQTVVAAMRATQTTVDGITLVPFSPEGAMHFFMDNICRKWQKTVSSFDGENKYIRFTPTADAIYFYALHGLRLTSIPSFIQKRFRIRDGFYKTGLFFTNVFSARINAATGAGITIKAAKTGYFGLGIDSSGDLKESVYLEAGESHRFTGFMRGDGTSIEGALLYIYQCDRIAEIDFDSVSLSDTANFSVFKMAKKIVIGDTGHTTMGIGSYSPLTVLSLGDLPFLQELRVRDTMITRVDASMCPRLETLLAAGSRLQSVTLAETAPIETLELPATISDLRLKNLNSLTYPGGMTFEGMSKISRLVVDNCPLIDKAALMEAATAANAVITKIRLTGLNIQTNSSVLQALVDAGATGIDANGVAYDETGQCSGLVGIWTLRNLVDDATMQTFKTYFRHPSPLTLYNNQMTMIQIDDTLEYDGNITNLENNTVDGVGDGYIPSGHINMIKSRLHVYKGKFNGTTKKMEINQVDDQDLWKLQNGEALDITDTNGEGYDLFVGIPHYWYKGINSHQTNKKYIAFSTDENVPRSSASAVIRDTLDNLLAFSNKVVQLSNMTVGEPFDRENLVTNGSNSVYRISVAGMKQVRWPGVNSNTLGGVFLDADDNILSTAYTFITHAQTDFVPGEYVFINVPEGAAAFVFTAPNGFDDLEAIAVDSEQLEAIEPDWVEHKFELVGVYKGYVDGQVRLRSISGVTPRRGTGTSATSNWWQYDANGDLTVGAPASITELNLTCKDWQNLAKCRGKGYQIVDYETHKDIANLWMAIHGRRNSQSVNGAGTGEGSVTGGTNNTLEPSPLRETKTGRPRTMGFEDLWGNVTEWMDGAVINVPSWNAYYKNHGVAPAGSTVNGIWHIHMPDGTERKVQGLNSGVNGINIARMRHGRYCDVVPSKAYANNAYNTFYCDAWYYQAQTGRCLLRSGVSTNSYSGVVYCNANNDSSSSFTSIGARLAFKGDIEVVD